jgi:flagellar hook-length control protein FliK
MHSAIQMFDVRLQSLGIDSGSQKIAVKMHLQGEGTAQDDPNGFAAIMSALMGLPSEELRLSLNRLDWVPLEDESGQLVPLIDMTAPDDSGFQLIAQLLEAAGQDALDDRSPNSLLPLPMESIPRDVFLASAIDTAMMGAGENFTAKEGALFFFTPPPLPGAEVKLMAAEGTVEHLKTLPTPMSNPEVKTSQTAPNPDIPIGTPGAELKKDATGDADFSMNAPPGESTTGGKEAFLRAHEKASEVLPGRPLTLPKAEKPADSPPEPAPESRLKTASTTKSAEQGMTQTQATFHLKAVDQPTETFALPSDKPAGAVTKNMESLERSGFAGDAHVGPAQDVTPDTSSQGGMAGREQPTPAPTPTKPQSDFVERTADLFNEKMTSPPSRDPAADIMRQIVARMSMRNDRLQSHMQVRLKPEFLGDVRLQITTENHQVMVRISADSVAVKEMIEQNVVLLKNELQQHGLQIGKFDVFVGHDEGAFGQRRQPGTARQRSHARHGQGRQVTIDREGLDSLPGVAGRGVVDFFA